MLQPELEHIPMLQSYFEEVCIFLVIPLFDISVGVQEPFTDLKETTSNHQPISVPCMPRWVWESCPLVLAALRGHVGETCKWNLSRNRPVA